MKNCTLKPYFYILVEHFLYIDLFNYKYAHWIGTLHTNGAFIQRRTLHTLHTNGALQHSLGQVLSVLARLSVVWPGSQHTDQTIVEARQAVYRREALYIGQTGSIQARGVVYRPDGQYTGKRHCM